MKSILRVILVLLFLTAAGSTAVQSQQQAGGVGTVPDCPSTICGLR